MSYSHRFTLEDEPSSWWVPTGISASTLFLILIAGYFVAPQAVSIPISIDMSAEPSGPANMVQDVELISEEQPAVAVNQPEVAPPAPVEIPEEPQVADNTPTPEPEPPTPEPAAFVAPQETPVPAPAPVVAQTSQPAAAAPVPSPVPAATPHAATPATASTGTSHPTTEPTGNAVIIGNEGFPKPPYPYDARTKRMQGTVLVTIDVIQGNVSNVAVRESCGYATLDMAATTWIKHRWRFPQQVTQTFNQPVKFELASN